MKLKFIVASMSVLGFVCAPAFAATTTTTTTTTVNANTTVKAKHHRMMKKHHAMKMQNTQETTTEVVYKDGALACTVSQDQMIMTATVQGFNRADPSNRCVSDGWFNRIKFGGGMNVDIGKFGNSNMNIMGENYQTFSLNDAYLNVAADINDWAKAFASIDYQTATINDVADPASLIAHKSEYSSVYSNNVKAGNANSTVQLEQAYATFGNFDISPIYVQVGKQYQDFGRYMIHPITRSMTQVTSETLATSLKLAFIANGFNGGVYAFDDPISKVGKTASTTNYGVSLGYDQPTVGCSQIGWDIGASYLYNMIGVNDVAYNVNEFNIRNTSSGFSQGYNTRVGAAAAYADINTGPFSVGARYTTALQRFNTNDLPENGVADLVPATGVPTAAATGAKPWAAGITGAFGFDAWNRNQNIYLGYQASREAAGLQLPKNRWLAGYGVEAFGKNTNIGLEWDHDTAYNVSNGGSGNNGNLVTLRAGVVFG